MGQKNTAMRKDFIRPRPKLFTTLRSATYFFAVESHQARHVKSFADHVSMDNTLIIAEM